MTIQIKITPEYGAEKRYLQKVRYDYNICHNEDCYTFKQRNLVIKHNSICFYFFSNSIYIQCGFHYKSFAIREKTYILIHFHKNKQVLNNFDCTFITTYDFRSTVNFLFTSCCFKILI